LTSAPPIAGSKHAHIRRCGKLQVDISYIGFFNLELILIEGHWLARGRAIFIGIDKGNDTDLADIFWSFYRPVSRARQLKRV
jgi:hypothetical protein